MRCGELSDNARYSHSVTVSVWRETFYVASQHSRDTGGQLHFRVYILEIYVFISRSHDMTPRATKSLWTTQRVPDKQPTRDVTDDVVFA